MTKNCTSTIFTDKTRTVADAIISITIDLKSYWPLTVRQVYYQLVARQVVPNSLDQYRKCSRVLVQCRENDLVPWRAIEDRSRRTTAKRGMANVEEWLMGQIQGFARPEYYGRCLVRGQKVHVEVTTEKDALSSILEDAIWGYCTRLNIIRGQASATITEQIAGRFEHAIMRGQEPVLLHLGDLDPSGLAIPKSLARNIKDRHGIECRLERLALNPDQVARYRLPVTPDAVKSKDPNHAAWLREYGPDQPAVELDALHPKALQLILTDGLKRIYDMSDILQEVEEERQERDRIKQFREHTIEFWESHYPELVM